MSRRGNYKNNALAESFLSSLKKNASGREYTKPGIWPGRIYSITLKCSITGPGVIVTSVASVRRPSNRPRREDRICLRSWGQSNSKNNVHFCGTRGNRTGGSNETVTFLREFSLLDLRDGSY